MHLVKKTLVFGRWLGKLSVCRTVFNRTSTGCRYALWSLTELLSKPVRSELNNIVHREKALGGIFVTLILWKIAIQFAAPAQMSLAATTVYNCLERLPVQHGRGHLSFSYLPHPYRQGEVMTRGKHSLRKVGKTFEKLMSTAGYLLC